MSATTDSKPILVTSASSAGGFMLLFVLVFLLSYVQKDEAQIPVVEALDIRSIEVANPEDEAEQVVQRSASRKPITPKLPPQVKAIPTRTVEPMPLTMQVDVRQVLNERDTLDYLVQQRDLFGAFGAVRMQGTDSAPRSIYIPPNMFPSELEQQGIYSGRVTLLLEISEQGLATVRRVVNADYPELVDPVIQSIQGAIYTRPKRRGKPTRTLIKSVIYFNSKAGEAEMTEEVQEN